jgi:RimJ/RimL family protein N-acetyltransferase
VEENKKLAGNRYNFSEQRKRAELEKLLEQLEIAVEHSKKGEVEEAEAIRLNLIEDLKKKLEHSENRGYKLNKHVDFDRSVLPDKGCLLGENDLVVLRAASEQDYENYMKVSYECSSMKSAYKDDEFKQDLWNSFLEKKAANYSIFDKKTDAYIGYCGIKDLSEDRWEIAIELLKKFQGKSYGYHALVVMLDSFVRLTGEVVYRSRVDPDNYASQGLMKKIGAQPDGISEMFIHGEDLEKFQEENKNLITDRIIDVAEEFCVDPIDLIGHVLEYRIEWRRFCE